MFKNFKIVEILVISITSLIVGLFIGGFIAYKVNISTTKVIIEQQKTTIELAIKKQTTSITNTVTTQIEKLKAKKSEPINIIIDPTTKSVITTKDTSQIITVQKKKGFFKRLFSKKDKK